jgi:hypothetical protein
MLVSKLRSCVMQRRAGDAQQALERPVQFQDQEKRARNGLWPFQSQPATGWPVTKVVSLPSAASFYFFEIPVTVSEVSGLTGIGQEATLSQPFSLQGETTMAKKKNEKKQDKKPPKTEQASKDKKELSDEQLGKVAGALNLTAIHNALEAGANAVAGGGIGNYDQETKAWYE